MTAPYIDTSNESSRFQNVIIFIKGLDGSITIVPRKTQEPPIGLLVNVGSEEPPSPQKVRLKV